MLSAIFVLALMGAAPADDATLAELTKRVDALEQRQFLTEKKLDDANGKLDKILSALAGNPPAPVPTFKSTWGQATLTPGQPLAIPGAAAGWGASTQSFQSFQSSVGASAGACTNGSCGPSSGRMGLFRGGIFGRRR